jgi:hypothetical protein
MTGKQRSAAMIIGIVLAMVVASTATGSVLRFDRTRQTAVKFLGHGAASGCRLGRLPDRRCTPGATFHVAAKQVCVSGYSKRVRDVPESEKRQVYAEYGVRSHKTGQYEVDHLIPLELGGSNSIRNLWPEAANPRPGFHEKDRLENKLHRLVCVGTMSLSKAQSLVSKNWVAAFNRYV